MRLDRDRLIFLSLCILDDARSRTKAGPVPGSVAIRLALTLLHGLSDGDRTPFYEFWRQMKNPCDSANSHAQANVARHNQTFSQLHILARRVGVDLTADYCARMAQVRGKQSWTRH